ncbi:SAG family member [Eimeria praecox]|uniref:SAG family member n=1 Tax=Eimeria praecox TaxID=51316 RepID=U6G7R1_9EIME|nr:SAG family member [Eimeria praecox]
MAQVTETGEKRFVISATKVGPTRTAMTCSEALEQWKTGFDAFKGKFPPNYKEQQEPYNDLNAVGLVGLLSDKAEEIFCGTPASCEDGMFICYTKVSSIQLDQPPVSRKMWHKLEEVKKLKPVLTAHEPQHTECVDAVNAVRVVDGLNLPKFTAPAPKAFRSRSIREDATAFENALYDLTCEDLKNANIDPTVAEGYTLIYATNNSDAKAPTAEEAVKFWQTGYSQLGTKVPPAFTPKAGRDEASGITGEIYYNNAVAGYVSIMTDDAHEMLCYDATGCANSALICFIKAPTLDKSSKPISDATWAKILAVNGDVAIDDNIQFEKRDEKNNCLTEINEYRTQESFGLNAFVAESSSTENAIQSRESVELATAFTCDALKAGNAPFVFTKLGVSVMYYSGSATCSDAVSAWKKGYEKFTDGTSLPQYTATEDVYKTGAATNFVSLVSDGTKTTATCYTVKGCSEEGLVCVLKPSIFTDGQVPIKDETWSKVYKAASNGAGAVSVYGALLSSVLIALGLSVLNF